MRIHLFRPDGGMRNYGDELNLWLFPRLFPRLGERAGLLYGIGTLLDSVTMSKTEKPVIVFGSGAGYGPAADLSGIDVRFVRGPLSAKVLGLKQELAITDPAILMACGTKPTYPVSFMPRWTQIAFDESLPERLADVGIHVIDPRWDVETVTEEIASSELLLTEALHGAIVADTLRIPWISTCGEPQHGFKWHDWCASMDVKYTPAYLSVSPLQWIAKEWEPSLSPEGTWIYRRTQVQAEVLKLNKEL